MRKMNLALSPGPVVETSDVKREGYSEPVMDSGQTFGSRSMIDESAGLNIFLYNIRKGENGLGRARLAVGDDQNLWTVYSV